MKYLKGAPAPFFLALCTPRLRDDALLNHAIQAFQSGHYADALLAVECVCRRHPEKHIPAILRAKILHACRAELAAAAWHQAWRCQPEDPTLQDRLLQAWLNDGKAASARELGPAFLPARCLNGTHGSLIQLLGKTGLRSVGACWKNGAAIGGVVFSLDPAAGPAPQVRLIAADEHGEFAYNIAADGKAFSIACPRPTGAWSLAFSSDNGPAQLLQGSPVVFAVAPSAPATPPSRPPVAVVMPVYRDKALVQACIDSVLASLALNRTPTELIVIDDASPEPALSAWLDEQAANKRITLLRNHYNLGFIETTNRGLRLRPGHDALMLNADTLVHGNWIDRLADVLYSAPDIASVTPWSNNGEITSFPEIAVSAPAPTNAELALLDRTAAATHAAGLSQDIELPACCGFAMLMRRSVIDQVGVLDGVGLVRGYGEEVDWCMRARGAGYRHLAATGVFVAHTGTVSFRFEKTLRVRQNRTVLGSRYPDYRAEYQRFLREDPLGPARAALTTRLEHTAGNWLRHAKHALAAAASTHQQIAPLPSNCIRIAAWYEEPGGPFASKVLRLARAIAALDRTGLACPLRLVVVGGMTEALWHTGVVDGVAIEPVAESRLLSDRDLLALSAPLVILKGCADPIDVGVPEIHCDDDYDPAAWLAGFIASLNQPDASPSSINIACA